MDFWSIVVLVAAAAFSLLMFFPVLRAWLVRGRRLDTTQPLTKPLGHGRKLIYFMAPGCGACRSVTPEVEALQAFHDDVLIVDASAEPELARQLGVMATPAFAVVDHGRIEKVVVGARSRKQIEAMLR